MRALAPLGLTMLVLVVLLSATDVAIGMWFPRFERFSDNFSAAYLEREVHALARESPQALFIGDSVLWGYKVRPSQSAVSLLRAGGLPARNLAFQGGSPVNLYALLRLMLSEGVHPSTVVFNVNQKEFSPADSAYRTVHPSLNALAGSLFTPGERGLLDQTGPQRSFEHALDSEMTAHWKLYALRSDLREAIFDQIDAVHAADDFVQTLSGAKARGDAAHRPTAAQFEGTYDLSPLDEQNVSLQFLRKSIRLLRHERIRSIAILTPTNHALLHDYIDAPEYRSNLARTRALLEQSGVQVIDLDRAFAPAEFLDNDHLTVAGNRHLAAVLRNVLAR